jgi:DNA replication and repair protein RecF
LKLLNERGGDVQQLRFWDEQLARTGARIVYARIQSIRDLERIAARIHQELSHNQEILRLEYQPAFEPLPSEPRQYSLPIKAPLDRSGQSVEQIQTRFLDQLQKSQREDIQRGVSTIGPHRDELRFLGNGVDLGIFGSRGQARTAVLSMKLAEVAWMEQKTGQCPVLLMDEVLAELDPTRRLDLLERILTSEQALLTTTDLDLFSEKFLSGARMWDISAGQVSVQK